MKTPFFALAASALLPFHPLGAETGQVTLPLSDFLETYSRSSSPDEPAPPIADAITKATLILTASESTLTGTAEFTVATYAPGWHLVTLLGGAVSIRRAEPADTPLVTHDGQLALLVRDEGRHQVTLEIESLATDSPDWTLDLPAVVSGTLTLTDPPSDWTVKLSSEAARIAGSSAILPARPCQIDIALANISTTPELPRVKIDTATIPSAEYHTRVVTDGSLFCEARVKIQHSEEARWQFRLPVGSQLLSCSVDGVPTRPVVLESEALEILVPEPTTETNTSSTVIITYTARGNAFDPVRGDLRVELPWTPLFVEKIDWHLTLPDGYEASAFEGNVEVAPESQSGTLRFQKHLARGDSPAVQIFYTKTQLN